VVVSEDAEQTPERAEPEETEAPVERAESSVVSEEASSTEEVSASDSEESTLDSNPSRPASDVPKGRGFTIQLAAYPSSKEADALVLSLRSAGFDQAFYQVAKVNDRTWYRVRVGVYRSRAEAESAAKRLAGVSPYDPYITTHP